MGISVDDVKKLRDLTGVGLTDAKQALVDADGDFDKALEEMRKKGLTKAEKKADREALEGVIDSYVHSGRIGVVVHQGHHRFPEHLSADLRHARYELQLGYLVMGLGGNSSYVHSQISYSLQIYAYLQDSYDPPQIPGHGLLKHQELHA